MGLLKSTGIKVINQDDVSGEFKSASQNKDYFQLYKCALRNFDYDFLLQDDSIFQFSYRFDSTGSNSYIRFAFFQNPQEYKSYSEFLQYLREVGYLTDETDEEVGEIYVEDYQQYVSEQAINTTSTSIRYDFDPKNYTPSIHSISHMHIGHHNDIRIPCSIILTPIKFCVFVIKHIYYGTWKYHVESGSAAWKTRIKTSKLHCTKLTPSQWANQEDEELFLS